MRHVSSDTYWLIHNGQGGVAYPHPDEFGWFICVPDAGNDDDKPADLRRLFAYARLHGCAYVNLDFDGPVLDDLPAYGEQQ